jgi:phosphatidylserine decarboxylase
MAKKHYSSILSHLFGRFAAKEFGGGVQSLINRSYVKLMKLDMGPFESTDSYASLNALFTRALVLNRSFDASADTVISPCDALVSEAGYIQSGQAHQIKGMRYDTAALLGAEYAKDIPRLEGGAYVNLYLSPRDYHRYHTPMDLTVDSITHIPGKLYPVNFPLLRNKLNLFIENERVVLECSDRDGARHFIILVGALNVGKMVVTFEPHIRTNANEHFRQHYCYDDPRELKKGELFGWFEMGSTIVMISERGSIHYDVDIGQKVKFGQTIGRRTSTQKVDD